MTTWSTTEQTVTWTSTAGTTWQVVRGSTGGGGGGAPSPHAASHENGGSDEVALDGSQITSGTVGTARLGSGTASSTTYLRGDQTWAAVSAADAIPETLIDAKGDLVVGTAADTAARLGVGADGQVLTADSSQLGGMKWAAAAGGGSSWSPPSNAWVPLLASYSGSSGGGGGSGATTTQTNGLAILQWCQLPAAVSINGLRVFLNTANGGASARAGLSLWNPDGPNGGPGTGISAPSANLAINGATGEKEVTWATPVTLPAGGFWFAWTPYGLDTGGTNPNFWAYPRGNDHLWVTGSAPSGNTRRPQMFVTGMSDYTPPTNPTVSSQHVLGSTVDATAVMVRIA